jgi:hypothetical protein
MVEDIWVTYFSKRKMACTEFSSYNNVYVKSWNLIVLFHFENRQDFLPHPVLHTVNALCRGSVVVIATGYVLDDSGLESMWRQDVFTATKPSRPVLGPRSL